MESSGTRGLRQPGETLPGGSVVGKAKGQRELRLGAGSPKTQLSAGPDPCRECETHAELCCRRWAPWPPHPHGVCDPNHAPEPVVRNTEVVVLLHCDPYFPTAPKSQSTPQHQLWDHSSWGAGRSRPLPAAPWASPQPWLQETGQQSPSCEKSSFPGRKRKNSSLSNG